MTRKEVERELRAVWRQIVDAPPDRRKAVAEKLTEQAKRGQLYAAAFVRGGDGMPGDGFAHMVDWAIRGWDPFRPENKG